MTSYPIDQSHKSPNHGPRNGHAISMIVLHATVGSVRSALAWLTNPASRVSSHYVIDKTGHISQLVQDEDAAWHAGRARWHGLTDINAVSLGIELENANNGRDPYPPAQLAAAHWLCQDKIVATTSSAPTWCATSTSRYPKAVRPTRPAFRGHCSPTVCIWTRRRSLLPILPQTHSDTTASRPRSPAARRSVARLPKQARCWAG
jgi:hypothetical protein